MPTAASCAGQELALRDQNTRDSRPHRDDADLVGCLHYQWHVLRVFVNLKRKPFEGARSNSSRRSINHRPSRTKITHVTRPMLTAVPELCRLAFPSIP